MQLLIILPILLHIWLNRDNKKRMLIDGLLFLFVYIISIFITSIYINGFIILICLWFDRQGNTIVFILAMLILMLTYPLDHYLLCWIIIELAFVLQGQFMKRTVEYEIHEYQNKVFNRQVKEVEHMFSLMRGWRHDYHNHLQNLKVKLKQNEIADAIQYLDNLEHELDTIRQLVESGNANMDAILNAKLSLAVDHGVEVNIKANVPDQLTISDTDNCILLGNLIDNAVEACENVHQHAFIRIYIGKFKGQLYISCTNSTNEVIRKLDNAYITSKRGNHGHGLKRINLIVEKYEGSINRKNEPGVFSTEILLPM